jgi:hypothetical protein
MNIRTDSWHFRFIKWMIPGTLGNHYHYAWGGPFSDPNDKDGYRLNVCQYISLFGKAVLGFISAFIIASILGGAIGTVLWNRWQVVLGACGLVLLSAVLLWLCENGSKKFRQFKNELYNKIEKPQDGSFLAVLAAYHEGLKNKYCVNINVIDPSQSQEALIQEAIEVLDNHSKKA